MVAALPLAAQAQGRIEVTASYANIRSGPGTSNRVVGTVERGMRLGVIGLSGTWYRVDLAGLGMRATSGYIAASLVREIPEPVPVPEPPRSEPPVVQESSPVYDAPPTSTEVAPKASPRRSFTVHSAAGLGRYRFYVALVPWAVRTEAGSVVLTRAADTSPIPSTVYFDEANQTRGFSVGGTVRFALRSSERIQFAPEAGLAFTGGGGLREFQVLGGGTAAFGTGRLQPAVGLQAGVGYAWGVIGEVGGTTPEDNVLYPPSGGEYPTGSNILVEALTLSIEPAVSLGMPVAGSTLLLEGGYRFGLQLGNWTYAVEHADDSSDRADLPAAGFSGIKPPELRRSGPFIRLGIGVGR